MKKQVLALVFLLGACGQSQQDTMLHHSHDLPDLSTSEFRCQSLDVTFSPYYYVDVRLLSHTEPGYHSVTIYRIDHSEDTVVTTLRREGHSELTGDGGLAVSFGTYADGVWQASDEHFLIFPLRSEALAGLLFVDEISSSSIRLTCTVR